MHMFDFNHHCFNSQIHPIPELCLEHEITISLVYSVSICRTLGYSDSYIQNWVHPASPKAGSSKLASMVPQPVTLILVPSLAVMLQIHVLPFPEGYFQGSPVSWFLLTWPMWDSHQRLEGERKGETKTLHTYTLCQTVLRMVSVFLVGPCMKHSPSFSSLKSSHSLFSLPSAIDLCLAFNIYLLLYGNKIYVL